MENLQFSQTGNHLHVEGYPDAVKVIELTEPRAKRVAELTQHLGDLEFAAASLRSIGKFGEDHSTVPTALWRSAVIHYVKCFSSHDSRFQLQAEAVYKGEPECLRWFEQFNRMRNRHIAHDGGLYGKSICGAILNAGDKPYKIERIITNWVLVPTSTPDYRRALSVLIERATEWVTRQYDEACEGLTAELEKVPYSELMSVKALGVSFQREEGISPIPERAAR